MSQKYVIVHFIDTAKTPHEFSAGQWPLHVTLLANFQLTRPLEEVIAELEAYAKRAQPFVLTVEGEEMFGPKKDIAVSLIRPNNSIVEMHYKLAAMISEGGAVYDEPYFMYENYRPHVTVQRSGWLENGQTFTVDDFTLVDMYPDEDISRRRIVRTFAFSEALAY